jgi:hypothetical protein
MRSTTRKENVSVLELSAVSTGVVGCFAQPQALDRLNGNGGRSVRVAPNELLLLTDRSRVGELEGELGSADPTGLVVDLSSAFAIWSFRGDARFEAFCRLSQLELPGAPAVVQGLVSHVPAKVVVLEDELLVLVSSAVGHHVHERVLKACADLAPVETAGAREVARVTEEPALA